MQKESDMKILIKNTHKEKTTTPSHIKSISPYDTGRYGAWGIVQELHPDDASVDVLVDGILLERIPVVSREWVTLYDVDDKYVSGERNLPPVNARVFLLMPTGNFDNCFVLCSGFSMFDSDHRETITDHADIGEDIQVRRTIMPGHWKKEYDPETGTFNIVSPDEKTSLLLDYREDEPQLHLSIFEKVKVDIVSEDSIKLSMFNVTFIIDKEGKVNMKTENDIKIEAKGLNIEGSGEITVKSPQVNITGGILKATGTATPSSGPFCALPSCLFTGAPHSGDTVSGT
jgi:hypothetical protein